MKGKIIEYFNGLKNDITSINKENIKDFMKERASLLIVIALVLFMALGFYVGRVSTSKESLLSKLEVALKEENPRKLSSILYLNGSKLSKDEVQPLLDYYVINSSRVDNLISTLKQSGASQDMEIVTKKKLFRTTYYIDVKEVNLEVSNEFKEAKFSLDNKEYIENGGTFKGLVPGIYKVNGVLNGSYGNFEKTEEVVALKDVNLEFKFDAVMINVNCPYGDGELIINGEKTGILVKDGKNIGPFKTNGEDKIAVEREFPWGTIKSDEVPISDKEEINININMENDTLLSEVTDSVTDFYTSVFNSLNKEDKTLIKAGTQEVIDKIYGQFEKSYFILKNEYTINKIEVDNAKSQFRFNEGVYSATIVVKVDYSIKKSFFGFNVEDQSKLFFTKIVFNGLEWKVEDVENFSL